MRLGPLYELLLLREGAAAWVRLSWSVDERKRKIGPVSELSARSPCGMHRHERQSCPDDAQECTPAQHGDVGLAGLCTGDGWHGTGF